MKPIRVLMTIMLFTGQFLLASPQVILTFDDSCKSHYTFVAPLLKDYGFGATFFITEGFSFLKNKEDYMTWEQIKGLHDQGFEIGNHTHQHTMVNKMNREQFLTSLAVIEKRCEDHGIAKPISFCYPAYKSTPEAIEILKRQGYRYARTGGSKVSEVGVDPNLNLPQAFDSKPGSTFEQFKNAVDAAREGHVPIITFHGVPDAEHPWVNTTPEFFVQCMDYLKSNAFAVTALREYGAIPSKL